MNRTAIAVRNECSFACALLWGNVPAMKLCRTALLLFAALIPLYHAVVRRIAKKNFERVNDRDFTSLLRDCVPNVHHRFGGTHALGGERHDRDALARWLQRLERVGPTMKLTVRDVWVTGLPHDTTVIVRWTNTDTLADESAYENHGVHVVKMRWGKIVEIDANEDSQAVAKALDIQSAHGNEDASAAQILS